METPKKSFEVTLLLQAIIRADVTTDSEPKLQEYLQSKWLSPEALEERTFPMFMEELNHGGANIAVFVRRKEDEEVADRVINKSKDPHVGIYDNKLPEIVGEKPDYDKENYRITTDEKSS